ncbi:TfoX/Sxy family protein [Kangiella shandongensis]|uniref:TfoX/Sxy family protein n=1 Tax=Kangiella shandongensis TaxID=2763258 RepID=UPI001CBF235B|nr:TfoX/Sxy family protein [Kangiella shandongensis]
MRLLDLKGLGPKSVSWLETVGIDNLQTLESVGAVKAYLRIQKAGYKPSMNLLYALVGALEDRHWADVAKLERERLLNELEMAQELEQMFAGELKDKEDA